MHVLIHHAARAPAASWTVDRSCEILGVGPVDVDLGAGPSRYAFLTAVIKKGKDITTVAHSAARQAEVQTALFVAAESATPKDCNIAAAISNATTARLREGRTNSVLQTWVECSYHHELKSTGGRLGHPIRKPGNVSCGRRRGGRSDRPCQIDFAASSPPSSRPADGAPNGGDGRRHLSPVARKAGRS